LFVHAFPDYCVDVAIALLPIVISFLLFQLISLKLPKTQMMKMAVGILYTYFGLVLFLTGVNVGFLPVGNFIGEYIGGLSYNWILIPIGMLMGFFVVAAEPAVHILNDQVEDMTGGAISKKTMLLSLSIGVGVSVGIAMIRVLFAVNIWYFLIPGYLLALGLTFFTPKIFTAIAFDSGGVASGPMTATFILPFAMGACASVGGNMLADAFGIVAMVAMTPLITIQMVGLAYKIKVKLTEDEEEETIEDIADELEEAALEWPVDFDSSDVAEPLDWLENTEFVENREWANELREHEIYKEIVADNEYIDFEADNEDSVRSYHKNKNLHSPEE
ncbi:MAG: DUF1538 domain-containing protein, partial [Anaerovorax sp.]